MNNVIKKSVSVFMAVVMLLSCSIMVSAKDDGADNSGIMFCANAINGVLNAVFKGFGSLFPKDFVNIDDYKAENFYQGTENFLDEPAENAKWYLGFGKASMVPENLKDGSKEYYTGGYFTQKINGVYDDQGANAIALNDNSGRGTVVMASVDGIGVCNGDVRAIRAEVEKKLASMGVESDIVAMNISSTHCHTVIDTQGFGLEPLIKAVFQNLFSYLPFVEKQEALTPNSMS